MITNELQLDDATIKLIVAQLSEPFSGLYNQLDTDEVPRLGESFVIWSLDTGNLRTAFVEGQLLAGKTTFQHHQIWLGDRAKAYAISDMSSGAPQVIKGGFSIVAERMHDAIGFLDDDPENQQPDLKGRLLVVPAVKIYSFWLRSVEDENEQKIYLFSAPDRFDELQKPRYFKPEEFLNFLGAVLAPFESFTGHGTAFW
jgi:hypothetical protein